METPLCDIFLSCVELLEPGRPELSALSRSSGRAARLDLEQALGDALRDAHVMWPRVSLATESYFRFLGRHLPRSENAALALRTLQTSDMFLAAACLEGNPLSLEIFEKRFLSVTSPALLRMRLAPDVIEEARQVLRNRFFVGEGEAGPRVSEYSGAGALRGWVRAALVRAAFRVARGPKGRVDTDQATLAAMASPTSDLELDYFKRLYGTEANEALREGFAQLGVRERNVLRQYFGLGLGVDDLAAFYRVHRATAARWVTKAREALAEKTREGMERRLHLAREDLSSILRLLQSQLEDGVKKLFATPAES